MNFTQSTIQNQRQRPWRCRHHHHSLSQFSSFVLLMWLTLLMSSLLLANNGVVVAQVKDDEHYEKEIIEHLELFHYHEDLHVIGPTRFPRPPDAAATDEDMKNNSIQFIPYIKPVHGTHRPEKDALVAFAAEYPVSNYLSFLESLRDTGFKGDVVLYISPLDMKKPDVWTYLTNADDEDKDGLRVILYAPKLVCYNSEGEATDSFKGGMRVCYGHNFFARQEDGKEPTPIPDPRTPRTVQTLRYELYWIMCQAYNPYSWVFVIDARDSVFQSNPFDQVPRRTPDTARGGGIIYMFGENVEATRLGQSKSNRKWLQAAYGDKVGTHWLADKPTICSGATLGEWIAMETYLRAMVAESDYTGVVLSGADQGFHNYLHYSHKLKNAIETIHGIVVFDQGQGIVNNLGAMRTKPLLQWGNGKIIKEIEDETITASGGGRRAVKKAHYTVLNWDGTPSPVVHQFDRHPELSDYFFKVKGKVYADAWKVKEQTLKEKLQSEAQAVK